MMKVGILSISSLFLQTDNFCSISFPTLNPLVFSCQGNFSLCLFLSFSPSVCLSLFLSVSLCLSLSCLSGWQSLYISKVINQDDIFRDGSITKISSFIVLLLSFYLQISFTVFWLVCNWEFYCWRSRKIILTESLMC